MIDQLLDDKNTSNYKLILVGVISKVHGIKGQVVVKSYTLPVENIVNLPVFDQNKIPIKLKINRIQPNGNLICTLENCNNRTIAENFIKRSLYCLRSDLPEILAEDEFYIEDLIGLKLLDSEGNHIGMITNVANYGGGDIIEVKFVNEKTSQMLPFTKELFPEINKTHLVWGGLKE